MSHLYDTIEPNVVSETLLRQCIVEQGPEGEAGRLAKLEGVDFVEVTHLRLDFQSRCPSVCVCIYLLQLPSTIKVNLSH